MASLIERLKRMEARAALRVNETASLDAETRERFEKWPGIILQRYCEGRLDALADELPAFRALLEALAAHGFAVHQHGSWHPLYRVDDEHLTAEVLRHLNAAGVEQPPCE